MKLPSPVLVLVVLVYLVLAAVRNVVCQLLMALPGVLWGRGALTAEERGKKVVVVTGADSGFGLAISRELHALGFVVVAGCLTKEGVDRLEAEIGEGRGRVVQCDVTNDDDIEKLREAAADAAENIVGKPGKIWCLLNNAGIAVMGKFEWISDEVFDKVMDVNFRGAVHVTRAFLPMLKAQRNSRIVSITSLAGLLASPGMSVYSSSKFALEAFMDSLRMELYEWNVHCCCVEPGMTKTPIIDNRSAELLQRYDNLPDDMRAFFKREDVERFGGELEELVGLTAQDPRNVVRQLRQLVMASGRPEPLHALVGFDAHMGKHLLCHIPHWLRDWIMVRHMMPSIAEDKEAVARYQAD